MIIANLDFPKIFVIVYIDLYLLYEYLIKLGIIKEKRLMINIMALK